MADDVPANGSSRGMLCVKGRFGTGFVHSRDRVTAPLVKRDGRWVEVSWDEALDAAADGLARNRGRFGALASRQGHERGRLPRPEVLPGGHGHQRRRSLHAPVSLTLGRGHAGLDGLRRHLQLVPGLRGGRLPHGGRCRCLVQSPGHRRALPPGGQPGRAADRRQSQARGAVRPGRSVDPAATRHRRGALQRDGAGHHRRWAGRRDVRGHPHRGLPRLAGLPGALHTRVRRASHRRAGA